MAIQRRSFISNAAAMSALLATGISTQTKSRASTTRNSTLPAPDADTLTLNRTTFGITQALKNKIRKVGRKRWLESQMNWKDLDDTRTEAYLQKNMPTLYMSPQELSNLENKNQAAKQLVQATVYRAMFSKRQLYEVMVEFWSNHFSIYIRDGRPVSLLKTIDDREVIRPHALGNFRELLRASSKSPAMLIYLDNHSNVAGTANENYARELMELHSLGVNGGYTETDVKEVARCFTGWTVGRFGSPQLGKFIFASTKHDQGQKSVLGTIIPANGGMSDGEQVIDLLASHPSTAKYISTKLVRRFVADEPPPSLVDQLTETFIATDGDIKALLWDIFLSNEFLTSADQKLKRPLEFMLSAMRTLDTIPSRQSSNYLRNILFSMGHIPFNWTPPDGFPDAAEYWASSNGLLTRWNYATALTGNRIPGLKFDYQTLTDNNRDPKTLVTILANRVLHRPLSNADEMLFVRYLSRGKPSIQARIPGLIGLMLASNYFQYR
ncbi:MAG TPA: DUF1800 domain-containing protein [Thiolapillus brandeum]|uniref:DUF1800 domain-containing protein n=1 Tax=Thiolapillus brandeum TaxID=1076588 RepID=A0A831NYY0_9GAMM|nr:DUF1800 domain-containing protein [Thiolapillus brandeum]